MSKVKYRVREFTLKANQGGTHSFFAEAIISTDIDANELARKIAARTGIKSYEAASVIHAIADIVAEETLEGSRISLANEDGTRKPAAETELYYYTVNSGWAEIATIKDAATKTVTHLYVYGTADKCTALKKDVTTPTLFDTVTFANIVEDQGLEEATLDIVVNAYGIQTSDVNGGTTDPDMIWAVIDNQGPSLSK